MPPSMLERFRAAAGGDRGAADEAVARAARGGGLGDAAVRGRRRQRPLGAVDEAGELRGQAGRQRHVDAFQLLVAVAADDVEVDVGEGARLRVGPVASKPGANGRSPNLLAQAPPPGAEVRVNSPVGSRPGCPHQGVIVAVVVCGPQIAGLVRAARGPPSSLSTKSLNGTCGRLSR